MPTKHRRAEIIDRLTFLVTNHLLVNKTNFTDPGGQGRSYRQWFSETQGFINFFEERDPTFPSPVATFQRRYVHWSQLDQQSALPALLLNFADPGNQETQEAGGRSAEYAMLGDAEEACPFLLTAVLKEIPGSEMSEWSAPITDQESDMIYSIERLMNGAGDLGIEGVERVRMAGLPRTSEGRIAAVAGFPIEVQHFRIIVTHIYDATTSV